MTELNSLSVAALLSLHGDVIAELRRRDIVRSANNPVGDYGEYLFTRGFGWSLSGNSAADADAVDGIGNRYQIKCRRLSSPSGSRQLGGIRRLPDRPFDYLAGVLLDDRFQVLRAAIVPISVVQELATYSNHVKAWRMILRDSVWSLPGVRDATSELRIVEAALAAVSNNEREQTIMLNICRCGCGEETRGGSFKPGHDQKLRAAIEQAAGGIESLRTIVEKHIGRPITTSATESP